MKNFERHPLSEAMGESDFDELDELQKSIAKIGVQRPVIIFEGKVLDGWNRYTQSLALGVECPTVNFAGDYAAAIDLVWGEHAGRRNWDKSRRAMAQARLTSLAAASNPDAPVPTIIEDAAKANVSERTQRQARFVEGHGAPEVKQAAVDGVVSVKQAERVARLPIPRQPEALRNVVIEKGAVPRGTWKPVDKTPAVGIKPEAHQEVIDRNVILSEEVDRLTDRVAVHFMEGTDDEKQAAAELIAELRQQVKVLEVEVRSLKVSRDSYQTEASELRKQCAMYRNQLTGKRA